MDGCHYVQLTISQVVCDDSYFRDPTTVFYGVMFMQFQMELVSMVIKYLFNKNVNRVFLYEWCNNVNICSTKVMFSSNIYFIDFDRLHSLYTFPYPH